MKVIIPGIAYSAHNLEDPTNGQEIRFIERVGREDADGNRTFVTVNDGTTNEELLKILIHRIRHQDTKCHSSENPVVISFLESALWWLLRRAAMRPAGVDAWRKPNDLTPHSPL